MVPKWKIMILRNERVHAIKWIKHEKIEKLKLVLFN
jgi:hypothetical protein